MFEKVIALKFDFCVRPDDITEVFSKTIAGVGRATDPFRKGAVFSIEYGAKIVWCGSIWVWDAAMTIPPDLIDPEIPSFC